MSRCSLSYPAYGIYPAHGSYCRLLYCVRNVVTHGDARVGKWRGNWRMEWVASTLTRPRNLVYPALPTLMHTPRLPAVDWTDSPADLNGLVRLGERRNVVSARVPSGSARALPARLYNIFPHYLIKDTVLEKKMLLNAKYVLWFLLQVLSKHFSFWEELNEILSKMYIGLHVKYRLLIYDIFVNCNWVVTRWQKYSTHLHTNNT